MKTGHVVLIAGAVLFVAGIAIAASWGVSLASTFLSQNTVITNTGIGPGKSVDERTSVTEVNRPLSVGVSISSSQSAPTTASLKEVVTDPTGKVVSSNEFSNSIFVTFTPADVGIYTLTVTNLGTQPVTVNGVLGHLPFEGSNGKPDLNTAGSWNIVMIVVGGSLAGVGVLTLIAGGVITVLQTRGSKDRAHPTTEGGITYRKD